MGNIVIFIEGLYLNMTNFNVFFSTLSLDRNLHLVIFFKGCYILFKPSSKQRIHLFLDLLLFRFRQGSYPLAHNLRYPIVWHFYQYWHPIESFMATTFYNGIMLNISIEIFLICFNNLFARIFLLYEVGHGSRNQNNGFLLCNITFYIIK